MSVERSDDIIEELLTVGHALQVFEHALLKLLFVIARYEGYLTYSGASSKEYPYFSEVMHLKWASTRRLQGKKEVELSFINNFIC